MRRLYERKELTITFVRSEENESDMMTKNTSEKLFTKFANRTRNGNLRIYEEWDKIVFGVDNPIEAQREDVVNWTDKVRTAIDEAESDESANQSDSIFVSLGKKEIVYYYV